MQKEPQEAALFLKLERETRFELATLSLATRIGQAQRLVLDSTGVSERLRLCPHTERHLRDRWVESAVVPMGLACRYKQVAGRTCRNKGAHYEGLAPRNAAVSLFE